MIAGGFELKIIADLVHISTSADSMFNVEFSIRQVAQEHVLLVVSFRFYLLATVQDSFKFDCHIFRVKAVFSHPSLANQKAESKDIASA